MSKILDIAIEQGESVSRTLPVLNSDGTPFNLTNWQPSGNMAKSFFGDPSLIVPMNLSVLGSPTDGKILWQMNPADSIALDPDNYLYNIDITNTMNLAAVSFGSGNSEITFTALNQGSFGNNITITVVVAGVSTSLSISVTGSNITINSATNGSSLAASTITSILNFLANDASSGAIAARALVSGSTSGNGLGIIVAQSKIFLSGGTDVNPIHRIYKGLIKLNPGINS